MNLEYLMKMRIRFNRGFAWFGDIRDVIIVSLGAKMLFNLSVSSSLLIGIIAVIGLYFIGWIDESRGIWKREQRYLAETLNPFWFEMYKDIKEIKGDKI